MSKFIESIEYGEGDNVKYRGCLIQPITEQWSGWKDWIEDGALHKNEKGPQFLGDFLSYGEFADPIVRGAIDIADELEIARAHYDTEDHFAEDGGFLDHDSPVIFEKFHSDYVIVPWRHEHGGMRVWINDLPDWGKSPSGDTIQGYYQLSRQEYNSSDIKQQLGLTAEAYAEDICLKFANWAISNEVILNTAEVCRECDQGLTPISVCPSLVVCIDNKPRRQVEQGIQSVKDEIDYYRNKGERIPTIAEVNEQNAKALASRKV